MGCVGVCGRGVEGEGRRGGRPVQSESSTVSLSFRSPLQKGRRVGAEGCSGAPDFKSLYLSPSPPTEDSEQWWSAVPVVSDEQALTQVHCKSMVMGGVNTMSYISGSMLMSE